MRYIIGLLIAIGLVIALIFVIVGGGNDKPSEVPSTSKRLQDYANTDATVRMTIAGPIVAEQDYRETRISVNRDNATIDNIAGYQGDVVSSQTYSNTREGYVSFLRAIDRAGFSNGDTSRELRDERGYCGLGKRYIFELTENGKTIQRFWTHNCTGVKTYLGDLNRTTILFTRQIPDYQQRVNSRDALPIF